MSCESANHGRESPFRISSHYPVRALITAVVRRPEGASQQKYAHDPQKSR